nr:hypothetical protein [Tanacetum cinerariifolium]
MSADSAVTYTSVHSEARSWSIPSKDPYKEDAQQFLEQAPRSLEYVPDPIELEDHVPAHIPEHPEDLLPAEDEAPIEAYIPEVASVPTPPLPPSFLSPHIRPPHTRAAMDQMRVADLAAVRAKIEVLRRERLAYEQESIQTRKALSRSKAYSRALEARVTVLETRANRHEWQRQTADDFANMAPKRTTRSTQVPPVTPALTASTTTVTEAQLQALIDRGVAAAMAEAEAIRVRNGYNSNGSGPGLAQAVREVEKYIGGLPDTIHDSVKAARLKTMHEAIEFATELMDKRIRDVVENKRKFEG